MANISTIVTPDDLQYGIRAGSIPYGQVDSTSTATVFTATVPGITELTDGTCVLLKNGVVTSASGFTININGLGAKNVYNNMAAATAETTIFNVNYTMLFVYDSTRDADGGWICYRGYNANDNTIGYQIRTNSYSLPMKSITYRYRLLFTSSDGKYFVPANNSSSTNATTSRTVCQDAIDPFGSIVYYGTTTSVSAGSRPSVTSLWTQYAFALGYSFNRTGVALTLTSWKPVYVKCAPQADGSAIIDSTTPYVQDLPSTEDGKIYIFLGVAYSATNIELEISHPIYEYKNGAIRQWTNHAGSGSTDTKVTQNESTNNADYEVLLSGTADNTTRTEESNKSADLTFNPSTNTLSTDTVNCLELNDTITQSLVFEAVGSDEYTGMIAEDPGNPFTDFQTYYLPDKSGTIALTSDISGGGGGSDEYYMEIHVSGMTSTNPGTITSVDCGDSTLVDITRAVYENPLTRIVVRFFGLRNDNEPICTPINMYAGYYDSSPEYSQLEMSFAIWTMFNGDTDQYILKVNLSQGSGHTINKANTI